MGAMEQAAAKLATKYGVVTSGKYEGCKIAMGNPPDKKVSAAYSFSQIIFVDGSEEKGRYDIVKLRMLMHGNNDKGVQMSVKLPEGDICEFDLLLKQEDKFWVKLLKTFLGQKGGIKDSTQDQMKLKFHNMVVFFNNTFACMTHNEIDFFESYFASNEVLEEVTVKLIQVYRDTVNKGNQ
jgi:hypothetical protein